MFPDIAVTGVLKTNETTVPKTNRRWIRLAYNHLEIARLRSKEP
jgi:hypothetical protein